MCIYTTYGIHIHVYLSVFAHVCAYLYMHDDDDNDFPSLVHHSESLKFVLSDPATGTSVLGTTNHRHTQL